MTDEVMAERRQLFLQEMARIQKREQQALEDARIASAVQSQSIPTEALPMRRSARVPRAELLILMVLCLALAFPVFSYIQREAQANLRARWQYPMWSGPGGPMWGPDSEAWRQARLQHARAFFDLTDIIDVRRGEFGMSLVLKAGLSGKKVIAHAQRVRDVLSNHIYPTRGPQPWRVGVCSADIPCSVAVVRTPGPGPGGPWRGGDGHRIIE